MSIALIETMPKIDLHIHLDGAFRPRTIWELGRKYIDKPDLVEILAEDKIPLEICLTSNVQTQTVADYHDHPVKELFDSGVPITLNTDDPGISNIDITHEYRLAVETFDFTFDELKAILKASARSAFADSSEKKSLHRTIEDLT